MVIDTSALIAILGLEPEAGALAQAIARDPVRLVSAASMLEASIVIAARHGAAGLRELDQLVSTASLRIMAVTAEQVDIGRRAYLSFGKGRHPASLNFGDCFSFALARSAGEPLLFKGNDFSQTDITTVPLA